VAQTLESELIAGAASEKEIGGVRLMAEILNRMNRTSEARSSPRSTVRTRNWPQRSAPHVHLRRHPEARRPQHAELLREVSSEDLAKALKVVVAEAARRCSRTCPSAAPTC